MNFLRMASILSDVFLAHRLPEDVGLAQGKAAHFLRDAHHLLLVHDHAVGDPEDLLDERVLVLHLFPAVLAMDVDRDFFHGAGPVQRIHGDEVVDTLGLELAQVVLHALRFELEHAHGFALCQQRHGFLVAVGQLPQVDAQARRCP